MGPSLPPGAFSLSFFATLLSSTKLYAHKWQDGAMLFVFLLLSWCLERTLISMFNGELIVLKPSSSTSLTHVPRRAQFYSKWGVLSFAPMGFSQTEKRRGCILCYVQTDSSGLLAFSWMETFPCYLLTVRPSPRTSSQSRYFQFKVKKANLRLLK